VIDPLTSVRRGGRAWWFAAVLAVVFLAGHLPFLASTLEDFDSVNFALGVRNFDPAQYRPHPPGYPIYIALGKTAALVLSEPHALAIWGALFGALAAFALVRLFASLEALDAGESAAGGAGPAGESAAPETAGSGFEQWLSVPAAAALLTMTAPLFWMSASRPMSDVTGLAAVLAVQALLATALVRQLNMRSSASGAIDGSAAARSGRLVLAGAFAAALSIGLRSQATWLTVPLLVAVIASRRRREATAALIGGVTWFAAGILLWFVPLVMATGGLARYVGAFNSQADADWTGVDLLITHLTPRKLAFTLYDTFVVHWAGLGWIVVAAAVAGAVMMAVRRRRALWVLLAAFAPYGLFHLGFQETFTTRYALPLVPAAAYLAVQGLLLLGRRAGRVAVAAVSITALALTAGVLADYAHVGSPTSRALTDLAADPAAAGGTVLGMHHAFSRPVEAGAGPGVRAMIAPPRHEWLQLVKHWTGGGSGPVWFMADPRRTDLALVDPLSRTARAEYGWPFSTAVFLGGIRPDRLTLVRMSEPGWIAGEGWNLTPETAGVAHQDGKGLDHGPIVAWVTHRESAATLMIGGRHLGAGSGPAVRVSVTMDGRELSAWTVAAADGFFLRFVPVAAGALAGDGRYGRLEIRARTADTGADTGIVAIEQFDLQDPSAVLRGFDAGWQEPEHNPSTGLSWRWASERAVIRTTVTDRDLELNVVGESPLKYFVRPTRVVFKAGDQVLHEAGVGADFVWTIAVPAAALAKSGGLITIESDQAFQPADRGENADRRSLALRIYSATLKAR